MVSVQDMSPMAITFVVIAVTIGIGATVLTTIKAGQTASSAAANSSQYGLTAVNSLSGWLPTIAVIIAAAIVIGILAMMFINRQ